MKATIYNTDGSKKGNVELPAVFITPYKPDVINRVFWNLSTHRLQPKGVDPMAGMRTSALSLGVGRGIARMARVKGERHPAAGRAAGVASVVKGRQAHPPKAEKIIWKKVNKKERYLATASAIAATANADLVKSRGHKVDDVLHIPLIVSDDIQSVSKTSELMKILKNIGLNDDITRVSAGRRKTSGKSRMRGRVSRVGTGPLIVVGEDKGIVMAAGAIPGTTSVLAKDLGLLHLAPGGKAGRLVIWSESGVKALSKNLLKVGELVAVASV